VHGFVLCTLVKEIQTDHPQVSIDQNKVVLKGFGRIHFAELVLANGLWQLSMVKVELGSPVKGRVELAEVGAGEQWGPAIEESIVKANLFQLIGSQRAKQSKFVMHELNYALQLKRPDFIRPFYWHQRLAKPPRNLAKLNFTRLDWGRLVLALGQDPNPELQKIARLLLS
jgi:hypothetical protein